MKSYDSLQRINTVIFLFFLLIIVYFVTRLWNLLSLPIFLDEAIYIHWAQQVTLRPPSWFISLSDGKQPLFIIAIALIMRIVEDPLLAGRLVSVISGFFSMIGLFLLGKYLFNSTRVGIFSGLLYVVYPLALVHDRLALYDTMVGTWFVWSIYFAIRLLLTNRLKEALLLSFAIGGGLLTKSSNVIVLYLYPLFFLLVSNTKRKGNRFVKWIGFSLVAIVLGYLYSMPLRFSHNYHWIDEKNYIFIYHLNELGPYNAFAQWVPHLIQFVSWLFMVMTFPILLLVVATFLIQAKRREKIFLVLWFVIPVIVFALFTRILNIRYILYVSLVLLPLAAAMLDSIWIRIQKNYARIAVVFVLLFFAIRIDYFVLTDFPKAPLPQELLFQLSNGWPSGGGMREVISILKKEAKSKPVYVYTEGIYGSLPKTVLEIYFYNDQSVFFEGFAPENPMFTREMEETAKSKPVYVIFNQRQRPPAWPIRLVNRYKKGNGNDYLSLYTVDLKLLESCSQHNPVNSWAKCYGGS